MEQRVVMSLAIAAVALVLAVHTFCWDPSTGATSYRLYWSSVGGAWTTGERVETPDTCVADPTPIPVPGEIVYYVVTAVNSDGESEAEHGPIN